MNRVCIIDDDNMYQMVLKRIIKKVDTEIGIVSYSNGEEAFNAFKEIIETEKRLPKIIFLDINMPVLDGWQFLEEIETIKPNLETDCSVYMISSSLDEKDKNKALGNNSIKDFLIKPLTLQTLQNIIQDT